MTEERARDCLSYLSSRPDHFKQTLYILHEQINEIFKSARLTLELTLLGTAIEEWKYYGRVKDWAVGLSEDIFSDELLKKLWLVVTTDERPDPSEELYKSGGFEGYLLELAKPVLSSYDASTITKFIQEAVKHNLFDLYAGGVTKIETGVLKSLGSLKLSIDDGLNLIERRVEQAVKNAAI